MHDMFTVRRLAVVAIIAVVTMTAIATAYPLLIKPGTTEREGTVASEQTTNVPPAVGSEQKSARPLGQSAAEEPGFSMEDWCANSELEERESLFVSDDGEGSFEEARYEEELLRVKERLIASEDPEHLHVAALLAKEPSRRVALISRSLTVGGDSALRVWGAVNICVQAIGKTDCPLEDWTARLVTLDSQNGEAWLLLASNRISSGDESGALVAMQRAASATASRVYWPDMIEMGERAFAAASDQPFIERVVNSIGIAAANLPSGQTYLNMCRVTSARSMDWTMACLEYGELAEREGKTILGQSIGRAMQRNALTALDDEDRLASLAVRDRESRIRLADTVWARDPAVAMTANPMFFSRYLNAIRLHGEADARAAMQEEVDQWVSRHRDLDCIP